MISAGWAWHAPAKESPKGNRGGRIHPVVPKRRDGAKKGQATGLLYANRLDNSRLETLRQMLADNPANTFARYGLAMEHVRSGDLDGAVREFEAVVTTDPKYSAAYYHGGQALEKLGKLDQARDLYRRGIAATRDPHALSELQAALDILGD
jgi:tetratricopeptide (TPR) repeat protein